MNDQNVTSRDQLDQMLKDGDISQEEFDTLLAAMTEQEERRTPEKMKTGPRRLTKNWSGRQIGGVCAGIGDHLNIDPIIIRILAVIGLLMSCFAAVVIYMILYLVLPWDDVESAREPQIKGHPIRYAFIMTIFGIVFPFIFAKFYVPYMLEVYHQLGAELPLSTRLAIELSQTIYMSLVGLFFSFLAVSFLTGIYLVCHNKTTRNMYAVLSYSISILWCVYYIGGVLFTTLGPFMEKVR